MEEILMQKTQYIEYIVKDFHVCLATQLHPVHMHEHMCANTHSNHTPL